MITLRDYKESDAKTIVKWLEDEATFRMWAADRFPSFPLTESALNEKYITLNGDCEKGCFFPLTAELEGEIIGSMILRFTDKAKRVIRCGFVVIDDTKRGKGYGKEMLRLAIQKAKEDFNVEKITIGVFEKNLSALNCYLALGFKKCGESTFNIQNENWKCIELEMLVPEH